MKTIEKPDIVEIIKKEGVELQQRGRNLVGLCPFHSERTPSFCVDPEKQSFKCYGCGKYGDSIDFIQHYKGLSFKGSLVYLGISSNGQVKTNLQEIKRRKLVEKFKEWCSNYMKYLCEMLRLCNQIDALVGSPEQLEIEGLAEMYLLKGVYQYHLSLLNGNEDAVKLKLYKEVCYGNRI